MKPGLYAEDKQALLKPSLSTIDAAISPNVSCDLNPQSVVTVKLH